MTEEHKKMRTCDCGTEFEPPEEYVEICRSCRIKEIRKERRDGVNP